MRPLAQLCYFLPLAVLVYRPHGALGQSPDQRAAIAHFRDSLGAVGHVAHLKHLRDRVASGRDSLKYLRLSIVRHRLGEVTGDRQHLDEALRHFAEVIRNHPTWVEGWYGLALTKLELHDQSFSAKEGPYQKVGSDYLHGTVDALIKTLELDLGFTEAAERLAPSVLRESIQPQVKEALAPLRRSAQGPGSRDPAIHMARGLIEREAGLGDSALAAFDRFLALGGDSAVGQIERARTLSVLRRVAEAKAAYYEGARLAGSRTAVAHYRSDLAWIATPRELREFEDTRDTARVRWLERFWSARDAEDGRAPGERLVEHYRRLFHVMRYFRLVSEQQQRGTLSNIRSPHLDDRTQTTEDRIRALVRRLAAASGNQETGGSSDALSEAYAQLNDQTLLRAYRSDQSIVDDRGVIYMRHGEPQKRARYAGSDADPNESWLYRTGNASLIFHFTGVAAPTTLVEQLPLNPELLASRGGLDPLYERMADDAGKHRLSPTLIEQERSRGKKAIAVGTSTDTYTLHFERPLAPVVQVFGVRQGLDGNGSLLVVFAAPGAGLSPRRVGVDSIVAYPLALRIMAREMKTGSVYRIDTTRVFATRRVLHGDEFLTGQSHIPLPTGTYEVRAVVADEAWRTGATLEWQNVVIPDFESGALTMSDPVLGSSGADQRWIAPPDTVQLNPLNTYLVNAKVEVYYQVGGMKPGHVYETHLEIRKHGSKGDRVAVTFREDSHGARAARFRSIGLGKLSAGEYVLTVTLKEVGGASSVSRQQQLNVTKR